MKVQDFDFKRNLLAVTRACVYGVNTDYKKETKTKAGTHTTVIPSGIEEIISKVKRYKMRCKNKYADSYVSSDYDMEALKIICIL